MLALQRGHGVELLNPKQVHFDRNRVTRSEWDTFAPHRSHVTELLLHAATRIHRSESPSLCILGAGNGNDLDFPSFEDHFREITLVDLDREALDHCLRRQPLRVQEKIVLAADVDVSGLLDPLNQPGLTESISNDPRFVDNLLDRASNPQLPSVIKRYDVVVSACLLTQMIDSVTQVFSPQHPEGHHPESQQLILALRDGHLRLLNDLCNTRGAALLISDFVSSDTLPALKSVSVHQLQPLLTAAIREGNFFTGVNPAVISKKLHRTTTDGKIIPPDISPPWRWQMGDRVFAVFAAICGDAKQAEG